MKRKSKRAKASSSKKSLKLTRRLKSEKRATPGLPKKPSRLKKSGALKKPTKKLVGKKTVAKKLVAKKPTSKRTTTAAPGNLAKELARWRRDTLAKSVLKMPERLDEFLSDSGIPVPVLVTADDLKNSASVDNGLPGEWPFVRGVQATMYRSRHWTMRQFAGFGSPSDTNKRFKYLIDQGVTGLSTAFDMPALMGYDADHPMSLGEVGREGVAISSLRDFEVLFDGIPLDKVTTSMTINATAIIALAMYVAVAEQRGIPRAALGGTLQNDMLKEFIAQKEWVVGPRPSVRMVVDIIEFCTKEMPKWHPVSISGYHIREAGATAVQELAFTISDGIGYVEECLKRGMNVDDFAPRLSFFWDVHNDFFEEIAKFRAARRIWAKLMRDRFGARDPRSMALKTHAQTAGVSLTAQQPINNVVRVALQALAAVLGGTQSLHTNSLDETYALPTQEAVTIALRTQQILAHESGVDRTVDPLGGSYFVEYMTDEMERRATDYLRQIERLGGPISSVEAGFQQKEIAEAAYKHQRAVELGEQIIVGINAFKTESKSGVEVLKIDDKVVAEQLDRLQQLRQDRNPEQVAQALAAVEAACRNERENLMPPVIDAVKAYATIGEISDVFRKVWGAYREDGRV